MKQKNTLNYIPTKHQRQTIDGVRFRKYLMLENYDVRLE